MRFLLTTFLPLFFGSIPLFATTFDERPFPASVQETPLILRGKIGMNYTDWSVLRDGTRRIHTFTELLIDEVFKGHLPNRQTIMIRELGGEKDGVGLEVPGSAHFEQGEDVVVFLSHPPNEDGSYDLRGMMMGKYNVERDPNTGREFLVGAGLSAKTHPAFRPYEERLKAEDSKWTLESLRRLVVTQEAQDHKKNIKLSPQKNTLISDKNLPSSAVHPKNQDTALRLQRASDEKPWISLFIALLLGSWLLVNAIRRK